MNVALPLVINRLVALLPTLTGWSQVTVYDGPRVVGDTPRDYVTVGFVDGEDFGGTFEPVPGLGDLLEESGQVRSELVCWTGDNDFPGMRNRAFGLFNAWQAEVQRDPTLGVASVSSASLSGEIVPVLNADGAAVRLAVTLTYTARGV